MNKQYAEQLIELMLWASFEGVMPLDLMMYLKMLEYVVPYEHWPNYLLTQVGAIRTCVKSNIPVNHSVTQQFLKNNKKVLFPMPNSFWVFHPITDQHKSVEELLDMYGNYLIVPNPIVYHDTKERIIPFGVNFTPLGYLYCVRPDLLEGRYES